MIGKILKWFKKKPEMRIGGSEKSGYAEKHVRPRKFTDPLYPPDLAEVFDKNRTERTTDKCLWERIKDSDK